MQEVRRYPIDVMLGWKAHFLECPPGDWRLQRIEGKIWVLLRSYLEAMGTKRGQRARIFDLGDLDPWLVPPARNIAEQTEKENAEFEDLVPTKPVDGADMFGFPRS